MENFNMDYYKYWEEFVAQWYKNTNNAIMGWSNPDEEPAPLCNTNGGEKSSLYIPEPWWGNDGKQPLHSVVINFNPGEGGPQQERENIHNRKLYNGSYADDIVNYAGETGKKGDSWPYNTAYWHFIFRARPVHNTLGLKPSLKSHLSVELIPWHTINVNKETHYRLYLEQNIKAVYEYSICFAAQESKRIANDYLKKPFGMQELIVRIKALLGRACTVTAHPSSDEFTRFTIGEYIFDAVTQRLTHVPTSCNASLSYRESEILRRLCLHPSEVVTTQSLLLDLWGDDSFFNNKSLHVFITKLRHRISQDPALRIINVRGIGYKLITSST